MGLIRRSQGRLHESKIELEAAIALDPNQASGHRQLGVTLMLLGQPKAGISQLEKSTRLRAQSKKPGAGRPPRTLLIAREALKEFAYSCMRRQPIVLSQNPVFSRSGVVTSHRIVQQLGVRALLDRHLLGR
jgi:hypothetical protein